MYNQACGLGLGHASIPLNANIVAPNLNMNVGLTQPPAVNMSQNSPLSFLSVPPPNFIGAHVFPSHSSAITTNSSPAILPSNMISRAPQPFAIASGTSVPDRKIFQNGVNIYPNNGQNVGNPGFAGNNTNAMYPAPFSQTGYLFNHMHNPNGVNGSSTPHYDPWSPPPSNMNNFYNVSRNSVQNSSAFQSPNRNNAWSDSCRNLTNSETSQTRNFLPKLNVSKPTKTSDINPWMNPPMPFAAISSNNYGNDTRHMQSSPATSGHNSNENSSWNSTSNKFFNRKSGNFSPAISNQNRSSFQHPRNSFKNFHNNKFQGRKNNFKTKEDYGGNKPYACDTCDRAYALEQDLKLHVSEHIKCNAGNCDFEAHPKIVALHKKMQHEPGYAEAINKLKDAEEIAKWRADRKGRFPTAVNILKRKAEQAEKEARGEVVETKDFGKMKKPRLESKFNKRNNRTDRRNRGFNSTNIHFRNEKLLTASKVTSNVSLDSDTDSENDSHIKLRQFPGMTYLRENSVAQTPEEIIISNSDEIDSDKRSQNELDCQEISVPDNNEVKVADSDDEVQIETPVNKTSTLDVISAKEDSDDEPPSEIPSKKCIEIEVIENKESNVHEINDDSEGGSPIKMAVAEVQSNEISISDKLISKDKASEKNSVDNSVKFNRKFSDRNRNKFSNRHNEVEQNPVRKSTLLEKLLADDIRHERNVIMQCIRYIVNNNFFGV